MSTFEYVLDEFARREFKISDVNEAYVSSSEPFIEEVCKESLLERLRNDSKWKKLEWKTILQDFPDKWHAAIHVQHCRVASHVSCKLLRPKEIR